MERWRHKVRARAAKQAGRIAWWQLITAGATENEIFSWIRRGLLHPRITKVYALGTVVESDLATQWEAVLYAGPGAMLSHTTAAHARGYISFPQKQIHVSTPRQIKSTEEIRVHGRRKGLDRHLLASGIPVTAPWQTILDLAAAMGNCPALRRALAQLDFTGWYEPDELRALCRKGVPGSAALYDAMVEHNPSLAYLNGPLEQDLYALLESWGMDPLPDQLNVRLAPGLRPDAFYSKYRVAIETDGRDNHSSTAQKTRDYNGELAYREQGITLLRYDWAQIHSSPKQVFEDLIRALAQAAELHGLPPPTAKRPPP